MRNKYEFLPKVILRSPSLNFPISLEEEKLKEFLLDKYFLEALYVSSPNLYNNAKKWLEGNIKKEQEKRKIEYSLIRYIIRMYSRSTPFGLFSGCSTVEWKREPTEIIFDDNRFIRSTRLDLNFLQYVAAFLIGEEEIGYYLRYFPNSSLYKMGTEWRYVSYFFAPGKEATYQLSSIPATEISTHLFELSKKGVTQKELIDFLQQMGESTLEARGFVQAMIDSQVLISELTVNVTGPLFFDQIVRKLSELQERHPTPTCKEFLAALLRVESILKDLDLNVVNSVTSYKQVNTIFKEMGMEYDEKKIFQIDAVNSTLKSKIDVRIQSILSEAWEVIYALSTPPKNVELHLFARKFQARYGEREMPIAEVLDLEAGIGFPISSPSFQTPLSEGISEFYNSDSSDQKLEWNPQQRLLWSKLLEAKENDAYTLNIDKKDIEHFYISYKDLPDSTSIIFRIIDDERNQIYFEGVGGGSAINLLGRFTHMDPEIDYLVKGISEKEKALNPGELLAEIVHVPPGRHGNVVQRTVIRDFEIPYLGKSTIDPCAQITIDDILVKVVRGKIILRSKKLGKVILPRFSTAYNFRLSSLPVFRFLCELQYQGKRTHMAFRWGNLSRLLKFFPRVTYKEVVIHPATWYLERDDFRCLTEYSGEDILNKMYLFQTLWKLPQYFCLVEADLELLIDCFNELTVRNFIEAIRKKESIELKEFFFDKDTAVKDKRGNKYVHQFVAPVFRKIEKLDTSDSFKMSTYSDEGIRGKFSPGSEWLFYKFYCGFRSADTILIDCVKPLLDELTREGLIKKWFFVRYSDPEWHVRFRLQLKDISLCSRVMNLVQVHIQKFEDTGLIWRTVLGTYQRELERYGKRGIELAEELFALDSANILNIICQTYGKLEEDSRWVMGFYLVEEWLELFQYSLDQKVSFLERAKDNFLEEFGSEKGLKVQLDKKFRKYKETIFSMISTHNPLSFEESVVSFKNTASFSYISVQLVELEHSKLLEVPLSHFVSSILHMSLNRLFPASQRLHELIIYYCMYRFYKSNQARIRHVSSRI